KTSIFSHPVYLFLREFSLQDFRGGSDEIVLFTKSSTPVPDCSRHGIRHILYSPW
ncbi:Rha family transcriptional regulator, partial [Escherichia coli]